MTVPAASPKSLLVVPVNASSIKIIIGKLHERKDENGIIRYYNISLEEFDVYGTLKNSVPTNQYYHTAPVELRSELAGFLVTQGNSSSANLAVECKSSYRENLIHTSQEKQLNIATLLYYTRYRASVAACTAVGCGPWKFAGISRTNEFHPTCPPSNASIDVRNSTSLKLKWAPLKKRCIHGLLTRYQVRFGEEGALPLVDPTAEWQTYISEIYQEKFQVDIKPSNLQNESTSFSIKGLKKFSRYCFQVSGYTKVGKGPSSNWTCVRTLQDCEYQNVHIMIRF